MTRVTLNRAYNFFREALHPYMEGGIRHIYYSFQLIWMEFCLVLQFHFYWQHAIFGDAFILKSAQSMILGIYS